MSKLDDIRAKATAAFAGSGGRNLSFDLWNYKARQVVNSVNGSEDIDTPEFDYWSKRESIIEALR